MHPSNQHTTLASRLRWLSLITLSLCLGLAGARAEATTGSLIGVVTDSSSKLALSGVRVGVTGTNLETYTDQQGSYSLANVPAGTAVVVFNYVGYPVLTKTASVAAGTSNQLNAVFGATEEVITMAAVEITDEAVGTARAINDQRAAPSLTNIVAADAIGELPDKNVAEALERLPGIDIARDKGEGRFVIIRGLDPEYIGISMNDIRMSTSEKGTREAALDTISSSMIASMNVTKVNTPDMDADDLGGSVNILTRTGFDQTGTQADVEIGTNDSHQESRKGGYNLAGSAETDTFDNGKLAVAVDASFDLRPFTTYSEPSTGWVQVKSPTDGLMHWIDISQDFRHYDGRRWRNAFSTAFDYKLGDTGKIWVRFFTTSYTERDDQWLTTFPFDSGTITALSDTTATVSIPAKDIIKSEAEIVNNKRDQSLVGGFEKSIGPWSNEVETGYTTGKYTRPTVTIAYANTTTTVLDYGYAGAYDPNVSQVSGPAIDSPSSYAFSTKSSFSQTTADMHEETVRDDLRNDFEIAGDPAFVKVGVEYRNKNNDENTFKEAITTTPQTLSNFVLPYDDNQDTMGGFPDMRISPAYPQNFYANQGSYGQTLTPSTTYGGAFVALEDITAAYAMGQVTVDKLKLMLGGRVEGTHFWISGWQDDTTTGVITPVAYTKNYGDFLPAAVLTLEFTPQTIARASWTNTLARPDYSGTVPGRTVNDTTYTVSQGNPELDPLQAMNLDASIEHYYSPLGLVSVAAFYKGITNFAYQAQSGTDPTTGYQLTTYFNGPRAWIYGVELNWAQRLSFLPAPLSGLGLRINTTLGDSQATYPTRPGETLPFVGYSKKIGNAAVTYDIGNFHGEVAFNYHGKRLESGSVIGASYLQDEYEDKYISTDASATYNLTEHWQLYLNGANLNNAPLKEYYGGTGSLQRLQTYEAYGWSLQSGIRWRY